MRTQLLCTFTTQHNLEQSIRDITKNFKIVFDKIYVLQNEEKTKGGIIMTVKERPQQGKVVAVGLGKKVLQQVKEYL